MGRSGPFRGNRGEATEGSIRTCTIIRWPGHVKPDATHARLASSATDRPIDGVDQSDVLFGNSAAGHRESMLSLIGPQLIAVRRKQWRFYLTDMHPTGNGP